MNRAWFWALILIPLTLKAEAEKFKLLRIQATRDGAIVVEWEKYGTPPLGISTNTIFVASLPDSIATGDTWEGYLVRAGAYTGDDGIKIPRYIVANSEQKSDSPIAKNRFNNKTVLIIRNEKGSGTGFGVRMDGESYIVTNLHVIDGAMQNQVYNQDGKLITIPKTIEIHKKKDLVRFKNTEIEENLKIENNSKIGEAVSAYGNSQGADVLTESKGKILGIGPDSIEISCEIVPGNSGGPVVSESGQLVGVASFLTLRENKWNENTRFSKIRKFALKLGEAEEWWKLQYDTFLKESQTLANMEESLEEIMDVGILFGSYSINKTKLSLASQNRIKAQRKVDVAIDSANRKGIGVSGTYFLFFQLLAEACEAIIEDGREFWDSEWAKRRYQELSDRAHEYATTIRAHRDNLKNTLFR